MIRIKKFVGRLWRRQKTNGIKGFDGFESLILNGNYTRIAVFPNGKWIRNKDIVNAIREYGDPLFVIEKRSLYSFLDETDKFDSFLKFSKKASNLAQVLNDIVKSYNQD